MGTRKGGKEGEDEQKDEGKGKGERGGKDRMKDQGQGAGVKCTLSHGQRCHKR